MGRAVAIKLDKERTIRFNTNAISEMEEKMGQSVLGLFHVDEEDAQKSLLARIGISKVRTMLWAGLKHEDRGLTIERTGAILDKYLEADGTLTEVMQKVINALELSEVLSSIGNKPEGNTMAEAE